MASPLYFFEQCVVNDFVDAATERVRPEFLARFGLEWIWRDVRKKGQSAHSACERGPGEKDGMIVVLFPGNRKRITYSAASQDWTNCGDGVWIGVDRRDPVVPSDLERQPLVPGYRLSLFEELSELTIPIIRSPDDRRVRIPRKMHLDAAGKLTFSLRAQEQRLWDATARAWDMLVSGARSSAIEMSDGLAMALEVLGVNYRYGRREQNVLGWLDTQNWIDPLYYACDLPLVAERARDAAELQKKTDQSPSPDSANSVPGSPGANPGIDPVAANSVSPVAESAVSIGNSSDTE